MEQEGENTLAKKWYREICEVKFVEKHLKNENRLLSFLFHNTVRQAPFLFVHIVLIVNLNNLKIYVNHLYFVLIKSLMSYSIKILYFLLFFSEFFIKICANSIIWNIRLSGGRHFPFIRLIESLCIKISETDF